VTTQELVFRLVAMVLGLLVAMLGGVLAWLATRRSEDEGCLPYVLVVGGLLFAGAAYPVEWGRPW